MYSTVVLLPTRTQPAGVAINRNIYPGHARIVPFVRVQGRRTSQSSIVGTRRRVRGPGLLCQNCRTLTSALGKGPLHVRPGAVTFLHACFHLKQRLGCETVTVITQVQLLFAFDQCKSPKE
jgi:hypothetical protein